MTELPLLLSKKRPHSVLMPFPILSLYKLKYGDKCAGGTTKRRKTRPGKLFLSLLPRFEDSKLAPWFLGSRLSFPCVVRHHPVSTLHQHTVLTSKPDGISFEAGPIPVL